MSSVLSAAPKTVNCDSRGIQSTDMISVAVWDGTPTLGWVYAPYFSVPVTGSITLQYSSAIRPDVALSHDGLMALVV